MNQHLQVILNFIQQSPHLTDEEKTALLKSAKDADKEIEITNFKLDRTEKVKRTTATLLEETIEELEQKRKAVEAQNHELEIEASLERVRAIALSMKEPADMLEVCSIITIELDKLNVKEIRNVQTAIFYEDKSTYMNYEYYFKHHKPIITETSYTNHKMHRAFAEQMLKGKGEFFTTHISKAELPDWVAYQKTTNVFIDTYLENASSLSYYWYSLGPVALGISTYVPLTEDDINLFKRFRNVFALAYRRYLDIEKAEAQAREAQIEAALEKVRSRSLAMHKSDELADVVSMVFEKLQELGVGNDGGVTINILTEGTKDIYTWVAAPYLVEKVYCIYIPYFNHRLLKDPWDASDNGLDFFTTKYSFEEKNTFYEHLFENTDLKNFPDEIKKIIYSAPCIVQSVGLAKHSSIAMYSYVDRMFSNYANDLLKRFSKVFEQAYVRFLDLQKAEAQTRESQIELGLERVRAKAMAMQNSDELNELIGSVFTELTKLDLILTRCVILIYEGNEKGVRWWMANSEAPSMPMNFFVKYANIPFFNEYLKGWQSRLLKWQYILEGKNKIKTDDFLFTETELSRLPDFVIAGMRTPDRVYLNASFNNFGNLTLASLEPLSDEHFDILLRFAKVFDLTYTRFNDLKQAEAQAREAQIQLALERVRARTMAMQHSDELKDAAALLFQQVKSLGAPAYSCGYNIWEKDEMEFTSWMSTQDGSIINGVPNIPLTEDANFIRYVESKKNGEPFFVLELRGERMQEHYQYLKTIPAFKGYFDYAESVGFDLPKTQIHHLVNFSQGNLLFITLEPCPEFHDVFKRFAAVFEQTYTRFLDLQKAEAQSRESQIELGLERVRARAMAMQKSGELSELVDTVFKELTKLDFALAWCIINIIDEPSLSNTVWAANPDINKMPESYHMLFEDYPFHHAMMKGWKERMSKSVYTLEGDEKRIYDEYLFNETEFKRTPEVAQAASRAMEKYVVSFSFSNFGGLQTVGNTPLSDASLDILSRFGKVFDLTYTRFNDLKQAEAQARESQIQ